MPEVSSEEKDLLTFLRLTLGEDFVRLEKEIHKRYRLAGTKPLYLRIREGQPSDTPFEVPINVNSARYFYLKSAIVSPPDLFGKISVQTVKYNAYMDMLRVYKCVGLATQRHIQAMLGYFPSELEKIAVKYPLVFRMEKSRPPVPKSLIMYVINDVFSIEEIEKEREEIEDPFKFSQDVNPKINKPIAAEPPHIERQQAALQMAAEQVLWDEIPDVEDE